MRKIPVIIVDDDETDRYIAKRRLAKSSNFGEVSEASSGAQFLQDFCDPPPAMGDDGLPPLVLMDVNMPGINGFETVQALESRMAQGAGSAHFVVIMFTSSNNPADIARAQDFDIVKAYMNKPLDNSGVEDLCAAYHG